MILSGTYSDTFPSPWEFYTETFLDLCEKDIKLGNMPNVYAVEFSVKSGAAYISFRGGNNATDAYARFARELTEKICATCGAIRDADASVVVKSILQCEKCV